MCIGSVRRGSLMQRALLVALTASVACGEQPHATTRHGMFLFFEDASRLTERSVPEVEHTAQTMMDLMRVARPVLHGLNTLFSEGYYLSCYLDHCETYAGHYAPDSFFVRVALSQRPQCLANTALAHELGHALLDKVRNDYDHTHSHRWVWDGIVPEAMRRAIEGVCPSLDIHSVGMGAMGAALSAGQIEAACAARQGNQ